MFRVVAMVLLALAIIGGGTFVVLNKDSHWGQKLQQSLLSSQAEQAIQDKDWGQAQHVLENLHQAQPNNAEISRQLAETYTQQAKLLLTNHPEDAFEKRQQADELYQQAIKAAPDNIELILSFSQFILDEPSRLNDAVSALNAGLKTHPHHAQLLSMMANVYHHAASNPAEDRPEIIGWLEDWSRYYAQLAIKYHPELFSTRFKLALLEQNRALNPFGEKSTDHLVRAARQYCNALLIQPQHIQARYNFGLTLVNLNAVEEGFEQLNAVKQIALDNNKVTQAQELAIEIQGIHNSVYNGDSSTHTNTQHIDELLHQCISDTRVASQRPKSTADKASQ